MKRVKVNKKTDGEVFIEVINNISRVGKWILIIFFCIFVPLTWFSSFWSSLFNDYFQWFNKITLFAAICVSIKFISKAKKER